MIRTDRTDPSAPRPEPAAGFTLIELLVVVAIIAVLMAIALPAMDRAVHLAELLRCSASLRSIGQGLQTYAVANKRWYPYRGMIEQSTARRPNAIAYTGAVNSPPIDDRTRIGSYIVMKNLLDPFNKPVDLTTAGDQPGVEVYANYGLWYGMHYSGAGGAMLKMGGAMTFGGQSFRLLAGDWDSVENLGVTASHPDDDSVLSAEAEQNVNTHTRSWWASVTTIKRGPITTSYVREDGSVDRFEKVTYDEASADFNSGARFLKLPVSANAGSGSNTLNWVVLPGGR